MFLNTLLLWGTALGSVPIIIHLLNKRRFRPVTWAAMEFLLHAIQKNARRLQVRDLILMLLRTLAIICLALALARPAVSGKGIIGASGTTAAVILIDNSLSMDYNNGRETRFDVAKRLAKSVISQLDKGAWCGVYTFNDEVRAPMGDPSQNLSYIEQELERSVQLSDGGTNVENAIEHVLDKVFKVHPEYRLANRELYLITDMQARPWQEREVSAKFKETLKKLCGEASVYLVNAGDSGSDNAAIVDLAATDTLVTVDMPVTFVAKIKNFGESEIRDLRVDLYIDPTGKDDKPTERSTVNVEAGTVSSVSFETRFKTGGDHKIEVRLQGDRLAADDRRYCTIEVVEESHMLLVDGRDQKTDDLLSSETGFLRFALSPQDPENPDKQSVIATEVVPHYKLADKNLLSYQAIALCNVARVNQQTVSIINRLVHTGMGLMIFLGDQADLPAYESLMGEAGAKLLPAKIGAPWGEAPTLDQKLPPSFPFATDKLSHPVMSDFRIADCVDLLDKIQVYRAYELEPLKDDNVRVVAYLANGKPAIVERKVGSGFVYLFAFPVTTKWSNLPNQYAFTIIMMRTANQLTLGNRAPKNLAVSGRIRRILPPADQNTAIKVTPPPPGARQETRPEVTPEGRVLFEFGETEKAGFYDVRLDRSPPLTMSYALNANTEIESNLSTVLSEQLKQDYPDFKFVFVAKSEDFEKKLVGERHGTELWPWLLAFVFVFLALESILAVRWAPRD